MEVAQVTAVNMEDDEHEACEVEKEDADIAHKDSTSKEKPSVLSEEAKADTRTRRTRTRNKENEEEAVNGVTQDGETNMNMDQNASEVVLKKEVSDAPHEKWLILSEVSEFIGSSL